MILSVGREEKVRVLYSKKDFAKRADNAMQGSLKSVSSKLFRGPFVHPQGFCFLCETEIQYPLRKPYHCGCTNLLEDGDGGKEGTERPLNPSYPKRL